MKEFDKIIGYKNIKIELERICDIMRNPEKYAKLGVTTPRGLLLHGEPGVGKTLMCSCFIEASGRKVFICRKDKSNGSFVDEIRKTFNDAEKCAPSIVFLDDFDKFANEDEYHQNAEEFVTVQSCIDECKGKEVFVLATVNEMRAMPKSLTRAGRFDKIIRVDAPMGDDAAAILAHYLSKKQFVADIAPDELAKILSGGSCAELETVINEAGVYAGFEGREIIERDDIIRAAMRVIFRAPENLEQTDYEDQLFIAYHEAGHAVIAEVLEEGSDSIVSVLSHSGSIGGVTSYDQSERYFLHKSYMENRVISLLGGKAATELVYGETDVGANSDLHRAFDIVSRFVDDYCSNNFDCWAHDEESDVRRARKETAIADELSRYYNTAKKILTENREFLDRLAKTLADKKTLLQKDVAEIKAASAKKAA